MTSITNTARNTATPTNASRTTGDGLIYYGWMFLFTIPLFSFSITNTARNTASITNQAIS